MPIIGCMGACMGIGDSPHPSWVGAVDWNRGCCCQLGNRATALITEFATPVVVRLLFTSVDRPVRYAPRKSYPILLQIQAPYSLLVAESFWRAQSCVPRL